MFAFLRSGYLWLLAGAWLVTYAILPKLAFAVGGPALKSIAEENGILAAAFVALVVLVAVHSIAELTQKGPDPPDSDR